MVTIKKYLTTIFFCFLIIQVYSQFRFDVEAGVVSTIYNDVRIPGSGGTFVSLSDDFQSNPDLFARLSLGYRFGARSEVLGLYAPLQLTYKGSVGKEITFQDEVFLANTPIIATYKFNSYRVTYRYYLVTGEKFEFGVGLTAKIRDALIGMRGAGRESQKTDLGVVPLINFSLRWNPTERFGLLFDGDALAAPQGRAEDVLLAITCKFTEKSSLKAGYRILEGGADNSTVYTFSMFHYGVLGVIIKLE